MCINNKATNPYFNLAFEEYLLKNYTDDIFMLWQNEPCVVVGKHQNALAEINQHFIKQNNIKVARRLSGGGTVYHDSGNLNFTYIMNGTTGKMVDFAKYTDEIIEVLNEMGAPAERNKRNDLIIDGKKISGNAEHIFKNRVIHHGTLLFNSDLEKLNEAIRIEEGKYEDKSVQSVRSKVTNILNFLKPDITIENLKERLFNFVLKKYNQAELYILQNEEYEQITKLKDEKYSTWDWIYGYSPKFKLKKTLSINKSELLAEIQIKKGYIDGIYFIGNNRYKVETQSFTEILVGLKYDDEQIKKAIEHKPVIIDNKQFTTKEIIDFLF